MRKVFREMQIQMRNCALHHLGRINPRALVSLQDLDLFGAPPEAIGAKVDVAVLSDPNHPRRVNLPPGPLLLYVTEEDQRKRIVVELSVLLYSEVPEVRKNALTCLEQMIADGRLEVTPRTRSVLGTCHDGLISDAPHEWHPAAVAANDALKDDIFCSLQGVRQCLECEPMIQDNLNDFVPRVLYPTLSSLDSIVLEFRDPASEHAKLLEIVQSVVAEGKDLGDACAKYHTSLGYIPLAPRFSLGEVVSRWLATHPETDVWAEVWGWARAAFGPVPRYHACSVFVLRPDLVPGGKLPDLWNEVMGVVHDTGGKGEASTDFEPWALRRDLARHFAWHLEAHLPDNDGANIACFAWWFAERVAAVFPDEAQSAHFYRENWVEPATDRSSHVWLSANPRIGMSFLRHVTSSMQAPWASGLLALMGAKLEQLAPAKQSADIQKRFHDALISQLISSLPFPVETPADPTFSLECSMCETALKWAAAQSGEQIKPLEQLVTYGRTLGTVEGLCKALRGLTDSSLPDQIAIALSLKTKAYTDPAVAAGVWEVLSDGEWRQRVLGTVEERVLGLLIEAFMLLQAYNQDKWFSQFPHFIAELCEKTENDERRHQLFLYVIHASLASDTVSAVRRLLRGSQKAKFVEMTRQYRERVESMWTQYPPWVQGRLRGLFASLYVV